VRHPSTVLLLPGQGAQRERMAAGLYGTDAAFTASMDDFLGALGAEGDRLRAAWLRSAPNPRLDDAATAQPLLLALGHALGTAVRAAVGAPDLMLGHSVGELAAAALAGVFPVGALAAAVTARSRELELLPPGGMLAVAAAPGELPGSLGEVSLAAVNGPRQTVLAGTGPDLAAAASRLAAAGFTTRALRSGHAFHSPAMLPVARRFAAALARLEPAPPRAALLSSRTAGPVSPAEARQADFWAEQIALPVRYWPALKPLLDRRGADPGLLLLDASPDRSLGAAARHHPAVRQGTSRVVPLLAAGRHTGGPADATAFADAVTLIRSARREAAPTPAQP
jgi:acyl transferase domain-containing protein